MALTSITVMTVSTICPQMKIKTNDYNRNNPTQERIFQNASLATFESGIVASSPPFHNYFFLKTNNSTFLLEPLITFFL